MVKIDVEVVVTNIEDLLIAQKAGIDRLEIASALSEGAITPSAGFMKEAKKLANVPLHAMIRPRYGGFCYNQSDIRVMLEDIMVAKGLGLDGIIVGVINKEGSVNFTAMDQLIEAAGSMEVTFHRAFDELKDAEKSLEKLIKRYSNLNRILTSGKANNIENGVKQIKEWIYLFGDDISIVPAMDVRPNNALEIIEETNCRELHTGIWVKSPAQYNGVMDSNKISLLLENLNKTIRNKGM